jgi:hypothetical protein
MNDKEAKNIGTGAMSFEHDPETSDIKLDFDHREGRNHEISFLNYGAILFFAADSYQKSYRVLRNEMKRIYELKDRGWDKEVSKLIMPLVFSFRHCLELNLKALYINIYNEDFAKTHDFAKLLCDFKKNISGIKEDAYMKKAHPTESFAERISEAKKLLNNLEEKIDEFIAKEYSPEFYRFLLDKDIEDNIGTTTKLNFNLDKDVTLMNDIIYGILNIKKYFYLNIKQFSIGY